LLVTPDLATLPLDVRSKASVRLNDVRWHPEDSEAAVRAIARSGFVILGLDLQRDYDDGGVMELAWSSFVPDRESDDESSVNASLQAAIEALARDDRPSDFEWVRVVWASPESLARAQS
jgi:hypothetical protein